MLAIRELRKVAWHGPSPRERRDGYLALTDEAVRLSGREASTGVDLALSIPHEAIDAVRPTAGAIVLELSSGERIVITPVDTTPSDLERLAHRLASTSACQSSPMRSLASA